MAEAFQSAVDLARDLSIGIVEALKHVLHCSSLGRDVEVLQGHEFGDGKAVVTFDKADLLARSVDAGLAIGASSRDAGCGKVAAIPAAVLLLFAVRSSDLQSLDRYEISLAQRPGDFRCGHDGSGCAVRNSAAVI